MRTAACSTLASLMLGGCLFPKAGTAPGPLSASALASARSRWPETTPEALERGRHLFVGQCDACHSIPDIAYYSEDRWPRVLERMGRKAGLSRADVEVVLRFILAARASVAEPPR